MVGAERCMVYVFSRFEREDLPWRMFTLEESQVKGFLDSLELHGNAGDAIVCGQSIPQGWLVLDRLGRMEEALLARGNGGALLCGRRRV